ncbi:hypothetical protein [Scrofimicrobium sp. R131]|uniref:Uncharacterized protein n=1 Tax=Scrofimicrobium appendicitidis TaxID=3079930 RepID=A0AAU7V6X3_9ACTO
MSQVWLWSSLQTQMAHSPKPKDKGLHIEVSTIVLEPGEEYEPPEPLWLHLLLEHDWPEDY